MNIDGVVANFETEKNHGGTAYQWFRAEGVLALLPLPGNRVSLVWSAPDALAEVMLFLASPAASYVNGHTLTVDGGVTATYVG